MDCYIIDAIRTPRGRGKQGGSLYSVTSIELLKQLPMKDRHPQAINASDCIIGCVMPVGEQGANIAKGALLAAQYPYKVCGMQINRFCSSGLDAIALSASKIASGQSQLMLAGGVESMSRVPMLSDGGAIMVDPQITYKEQIIPQGISADLIANLNDYNSTMLNEVAISSHQKAAAAQKNGAFKSAIIPIKNTLGETILDHDENIRPDTNLETLNELNPSFQTIGHMGGFGQSCLQKYPELEQLCYYHTAGNSSALADGAGLVFLASKKACEDLQIAPKARILGYESAALDPTIMLTAPKDACQALLERLNLSIQDIDVIEINEAFSSMVLYYIEKMRVNTEKVNIHGGAIAMGHPLGATGAIILSTAVELLIERNQRYGLISLCTAGGMSIAMCIENMELKHA
jgi:acetyl-CoA C-acetyltransferase